MTDHLIVFITAGSDEEARRIGDALVVRKLAACANLTPVTSIFFWDDAMQDESEILLIVKTRAALFDALMQAVKDLHSYDTPEIIALPIVRGSQDYLDWITAETGG